MMRPYPAYLVHSVTLADGATLVIRPIAPDDAEIEQEFVRNLSAESRYLRFMESLHELSPRMLAHFTQIDYDRHMALVAVTPCSGREVGVARYIVAPDNAECEFAVAVADSWQRKGVGIHLMDALMSVARGRGLTRMHGDVLAGNLGMLALTRRFGFRVLRHTDDARLVRVEALL